MRIAFDNKRVVIAEAPKLFAKKLDEATAYYVKGFNFSPAWKNKFWDGKIHLLKLEGECYTLPVGMLSEVFRVAENFDIDYRVIDGRERAKLNTLKLDWSKEFVLREYQKDAVDAATKLRGYTSKDDYLTGRGIIRLPTRAGKTVIAAGIIKKLGVETLIITPSKLVMEQTVKLFQKVFKTKRIGVIGSGRWDPAEITVASIQTIAKRVGDEESMRDLLRFQCIIMDECHHLTGEEWRKFLLNSPAEYKIGLTATFDEKKKRQMPKAEIWVNACTGPIMYTLQPSDLIRMGFLIRPMIYLHAVEGPELPDDPDNPLDWHDIEQVGIIEHKARNKMIVDIVRKRNGQGLQVLVITSSIIHTHDLKVMIESFGLSAVAITGETPNKERKAYIEKYIKKDIDVIVSTVFGEGVDLPAIESVVVAEGGKSRVSIMQRFRCLTPAEGKTTATLDDFVDLHHPILAAHSKIRMKTYQEHEEFKVVVGDLKK